MKSLTDDVLRAKLPLGVGGVTTEIDGILTEIGGELSRIDGSRGRNSRPESRIIIVLSRSYDAKTFVFPQSPEISCRMAIVDCFRTLLPDMTSADVAAVIGPPQEIHDTTVPEGSAWGLQESLKYKIQAGEPVLQWTFFDAEHDHVVWFAKLGNEWRLTLRLSLPRGLASNRARK